jgi:glycosyltransferase involved in cell wall biosynthesis
VKILYVLEYFYPHIGGVETLFESLTKKVSEEGHTITVITNKYSKELKSVEIIDGVTIKRYPFMNRYLFTLLAVFPTIKEALKHDIIHTTSYNAGLPSFFGGLLTRTKVIITFHEVWTELWDDLPFMGFISRFFHRSFEAFLLKLPFTKFVAVSNSTKQALLSSGVNSDRVLRIYNGLDYEKLVPTPKRKNKTDAAFAFCYFGRLGVSKGLNVLMEAMVKLKQSSKVGSFKLTLIVPKEKNAVQAYVFDTIKENDLESIIEFKHELSREALFEELAQVDTIIIPSYSEGFGFTAAEASALGIPIISSGRGSLSEVVSGKHLEFSPYTGEGLFKSLQLAMKGEWEKDQPLIKFNLSESVDEYVQLYHEIHTN